MPSLRASLDDAFRDLAVVARGDDLRPARDPVRIGGGEARAEVVPAFAVHVEARRVRGAPQTDAQRVLHFLGNVPPLALLQLDADQDPVLRLLLVPLDPGLAEVRRLQDLPDPVEVGPLGELDGDLRAAGEVDPELQPLLHEDREEPDRDQEP